MALIVPAYRNDLISIFDFMYNTRDSDDKIFSEKFSAAAKEYAESGDITTADAGGVPSGAYVGTGTGKITVDDSICENIVYAACLAVYRMDEGGDEYLATQSAAGIDAMIAAGVVKTNVTGVVTPPNGYSYPLNGTATGNMVGVPAPMRAAFLAAFNVMYRMDEGGDEYLAQQMSAAVDAYLKAGVVTTKGDAQLTGSTGTGKMA
jgi:hypothetical protein